MNSLALSLIVATAALSLVLIGFWLFTLTPLGHRFERRIEESEHRKASRPR